jgi:pimeloyl-ACP methyl ester carboxylesterase
MTHTSPTVVLVHGAFADGSSYASVTKELLAEGIQVIVPAVPNRSLVGDAAYIASVIRNIDGPVVLVGHSYGGAVITVAGTEENVKALVYLSAYVLEEGESLGELQGRSVDISKFPAIFAAGVDEELAKVLAVSQRPLAAVAFTEKASAAAWKTKPSWGSVSSADQTINPEVERFGYKRGNVTTIEVDSSHLVMLSHPKEVVDLIHQAINATSGQ